VRTKIAGTVRTLIINGVNVIGAGLAGCEAAYQLAKRGIDVTLYDIKPQNFTPAHTNADFAELVCSNSLKSNEITNACGLLKQEMRLLNSLIIACADKTAVAAGSALAVDRNLFARTVTEEIKKSAIKIICKEITDIEDLGNDRITIIATGPLTSEGLCESISKITESGNLYFFDAAAPIIDAETIDRQKTFICDRYGKGEGDYLNCPLDRKEYYTFVSELINAKTAELKNFEQGQVFEGCMPIEVLAKRGGESLMYGPLKPVGLKDAKGNTPFAAVQLRRENAAGSCYNMVGFQTNLLFGEQKRVFPLIPALRNAEFLKYGVMHRNTYINSPKLLNAAYQLKRRGNIFFAGQISGVEGYVESAASGLTAALNIYSMLKGGGIINFTNSTQIGALAAYITAANENFQPINANFGILKPLDENIRDKKQKYLKFAERSLKKIEEIKVKYNIG
jgi:methylenetetrahydrofolate--tRNA-(uracil-5-)-methyltransferase